MKKKISSVILIILALAVVIVLANSLYTVKQKQFVAVRQFGKVLLFSINNGKYLVTTNPYLVTITILGFGINVANGLQQLFG